MAPFEPLLRDYDSADYPSLTALWERLGLGGVHRGDGPEIIDATLRQGGRLLVLVEENGTLIGSAWITSDARRLYLHHVGVAQEHHGQGLGERLTRAALDIARAQRLQIKLEVGRTNERAQRLYRRLGFQPLGDYDVLIERSTQHG